MGSLRYYVWEHCGVVQGWQCRDWLGSESGDFGVDRGERQDWKRMEASTDLLYWHYDEDQPMPKGWREATAVECQEIEWRRAISDWL